jgi:acetyl-CoA carboxylase carboxyl transferase subunit beta
MSSVDRPDVESSAGSSPAHSTERVAQKRGVPAGLWLRCEGCKATVFRKQVDDLWGVCPEAGCGYHFYLSAHKRIRHLLDADSFEEWFANITPKDPLGFVDKRPYTERLAEEQARTGLREACIVGRGYLRGRPLVFGVTDSAFIMGSMGSVVGEKLTRAVEAATELGLPLVIVSASGGGARMHEGILSLMQMGKVSAALARYQRKVGLFISVLTNPTMGGVAASFASLGDIVLAEPRALIGFAGPRVVKATVNMALPKGFQTSEFLLEHGFIDRIVPRAELGKEIARLIDYCAT